jgi:hypothetical protein
MKAAGLAEAARTRLAESRRDRDGHTSGFAANHLELVPLAHRRLVDVAREDEIGAGVDERAQDVVPV